MAGIGFELRKILQGRSYLSLARAYAYAAVIGSGPWIVSILSLGVLGLVFAGTGHAETLRTFFVAVAHIYCVTLILAGPVQTVMTRYAADRQFCREEEKIFPCFVTVMAITAFANAGLGLVLFLGFVAAPPLFQISCAGLMVLASCVWVASIYLTAIKKYHQILLAFVAGYGCSCLAAWGLGMRWGASAAMLGFAWGHAILLGLLLVAIHRELGNSEPCNLEFLHYFKKHCPLAFCGLFYNLGIWSDKMSFWWLAPDSTAVPGFLRESSLYDNATYLAFPSMAPGIAVFLIQLETGFSIKYQEFFQQVLRKATFREIRRVKQEMIEALRRGLLQLVKVQALVSLWLIVMADRVLFFLRLTTVNTTTFQLVLVGAFLLVLFLSLLTVLLYLNKLQEAMACSLVFFLLNTTVTLWGLNQGIRWHGFGFVVASGTAMMATACCVNHHLQRLEFETFTGQKLYPEEA